MLQYIIDFITPLAIVVFIVAIVIAIIVNFRKPTTRQNNTNKLRTISVEKVGNGRTVSTEEAGSVNFDKYLYRLRQHIMTAYEEQIFSVLCSIFESKCYVIPQVHLSKLLDHKVKGQSWQGAFAHINGKSVDFVLLRKSDLSPICAIEIDDWTHRLDRRKERDAEVERMFASAKLPLVRLKYVEYMTKQEIVDQIAKVMNQLR